MIFGIVHPDVCTDQIEIVGYVSLFLVVPGSVARHTAPYFNSRPRALGGSMTTPFAPMGPPAVEWHETR